MRNKLKNRVSELETEIQRLQKPEKRTTDYEIKTILDYLIGDDIKCPICGSKMRFGTSVISSRYHLTNVSHTLVCPIDHFTVMGNSFKECIDELKRVEVVKTEN